MATKKQQSEHSRALERVAAASEQGGFAVTQHPNLGYSRVRVAFGTTLVLGGDTDPDQPNETTDLEQHKLASKHIGEEVPYDDDKRELVIPTAMAMQYEALGQVEILGRVNDDTKGAGE